MSRKQTTFTLTVPFPIDFVNEMLEEGLKKPASGFWGKLEVEAYGKGLQNTYERQEDGSVVQTSVMKDISDSTRYYLEANGGNKTIIYSQNIGTARTPTFLC